MKRLFLLLILALLFAPYSVQATQSLAVGDALIGGNLSVGGYACAAGTPCTLCKISSANLNSTSDQACYVGPLIQGSSTYVSGATKYVITEIDVANCSTPISTAQGGVYTAASKGGTIIGAATTGFTNCTSSTTRQRLTGVTNMDTTLLTAGTLYLSLTTAQGAAATGDVYIIGIPLK